MMATPRAPRFTAAFAALAALVVPPPSAAQPPEVAFAAEGARILSASGAVRPARKGARLQAGESLATGDTPAQLIFDDGSFLSVQPASELKVDEADGPRVAVTLRQGGLRADLAAGGATHRVATPLGRIESSGARYAVRQDDELRIHADTGRLSVTSDAGSVDTPGGEAIRVRAATTPQITRAAPLIAPAAAVPEIAPPANPAAAAAPPVPALAGSFDASIAIGFETITRARTAVPVQMGPDGSLVRAGPLDGEDYAGAADPRSIGNDGIVAWGTWPAGTVLQPTNQIFAGAPVHYVISLPPSSVPMAGSAIAYDYDMIGATASCNRSCTGVSVDQSSLAVDFATYRIELGLQLSVTGLGLTPGRFTYTQQTGGISGVMWPHGAFNSRGRLLQTGGLNPQLGVLTGDLEANGFLGGPQLRRAGIAFSGVIYNFDNMELLGSIAYRRR
ncbi:MAG TPA: FecR family protein [Burkholderiales bacterium]|nr:FecR family protein [Burkholderiales bacterium]